MKFRPYSRYIQIELVEDEPKESESLVVLPTDYKKPERPYGLGRVVSFAYDVKLGLQVGEVIIFEKRMLNKIEVFGKMHYLVLENYVYGGIVE
mgnify:CR=1 FL=1